MKKIRMMIAVLGIVAGLVAFAAPAAQAKPLNVFSACSANESSQLCKGKSGNASDMIHNIINLLIYAVGIIAVIMIVVGGLRYTLSGGDSNGLTTAKNTIMYAVVGLVVAVMAYAIVNFVIARL